MIVTEALIIIPAIPPAARSLVRTADPTGTEPSRRVRGADRTSLAGATSRASARGLRTGGAKRLRLLPPGAAPIIIADAGFKVPIFRAVEALGWRWVGRLRGRDYVRLKTDWISSKSLFPIAAIKPVRLGIGHWVKSNPLPALMVLVRLASA